MKFGSHTTAQQVVAEFGSQLAGKVIIVTGGNSGKSSLTVPQPRSGHAMLRYEPVPSLMCAPDRTSLQRIWCTDDREHEFQA
jgi:hypothetical protein